MNKFAAKGAWFEIEEREDCCKNCTDPDCVEAEKNGAKDCLIKKSYNIYKDPSTGDGTKKSLKGMVSVIQTDPLHNPNSLMVIEECTPEQENTGLLQVIYENGTFVNSTSFKQIRKQLLNKKLKDD